MKNVVIVGAARTPFGSFLGGLSSISAPKLGAHAIQHALRNAELLPSQVSEVIFGHVLSGGVGQAPARQASILATIPSHARACTINKVCGSGMKAIMLACQSILLDESEIVVAGGMESMSQAPFLVPQARLGVKMGHQTLVDSMIHDGLWDPYHGQHMGQCAELCAKKYSISREEQDEFAKESFRKALASCFVGEIAPIDVTIKKESPLFLQEDEGPKKVQFDKMSRLKPAFDPKGSITAANASSLNDGAAALVLMSSEEALKRGLKPLARILGSASHSQDPEWFTTAPVGAIQKLLNRLNLTVNQVDLFEINEAFAVVALAAQKELSIPDEKLNSKGGAIALGHPIGASGARLPITLLHNLKEKGLKTGVASLCIGGGEATALAIEVVS